jgi:hypothetical protein
MVKIRDWKTMTDMMARLLIERTGENVAAWNRRIAKEKFKDKSSLRRWLTKNGVTGYAQTMLVMEQFGYPDYLVASADKLIEGQYEDRSKLRPIYNAIIKAAVKLGDITIQARKTYVSLVTPKRTFARIQPTTKDRIDLGLRLEDRKPGGRLKPSRMNETMKLQVGLNSLSDLDKEVLGFLKEAYQENT